MSLRTVAEAAAPVSDAGLLAEFVESESSEAFASLVNRHSPMVLGVCRRMLGDADAEDAAQSVFVLFWQKAKQLRAESMIAGWLHRTAHHVCRNALRSKTSRLKHEQQAAAESTTVSTESPDSLQWCEIRAVLDEEVNSLPDKLRTPFVLFHLEQRSLAEVAALVGSNVSTVGSWLQRSRERLAGRLRKRGVAVGATALAALLSRHAVAEAVPAAFAATAVQTATALAAGGMAGGPASTSAVASLAKAFAAGCAANKAWIVAGLVATTLVGFPWAIFWLLPMLQTRQSADFSLLQGRWREVAHEQNGGPMNALPRVEFVGSLVISGRQFHRFQTLAGGKVLDGERGTFVLDDTRQPKSIDFKVWLNTAYGAYELNGDTLTLCVTKDGGPRPGTLSTAKNDGRVLNRYLRVK